MVDGIKGAVSNIGDTVRNGFNSAIDFIASLPSKAIGWGKDFIDGLASGIRDAIGSVTDAVEGVADKIRSFLHFSRPDEGPLREYEKWMPDFMQGMARGIYESIPQIAKAASMVAKTIDYSIVREPQGQTIDYGRVYDAVRSGASSSESVIYIGDKKFKRILREAGVALE